MLLVTYCFSLTSYDVIKNSCDVMLSSTRARDVWKRVFVVIFDDFRKMSNLDQLDVSK